MIFIKEKIGRVRDNYNEFKIVFFFLILMFVVVVVKTLVIRRLWASSSEENTRVNGIDVNLSRVLKSQNNGHLMLINKFDLSTKVNEWLKDLRLIVQVNEIYRNQHNILLYLLSPECLRIVRNIMAPNQPDFTCMEILRI